MTTNDLKQMKRLTGNDLRFRVEDRGNIFRAEFWRGAGDAVESFTGMSTDLDRAINTAFLSALHAHIQKTLDAVM
jgi:hypothetical protein